MCGADPHHHHPVGACAVLAADPVSAANPDPVSAATPDPVSAATPGPPPGYRFYVPPVYTERPPRRWVVATTGLVLGGLSLLVALFDPRKHTLGTCPMVLVFGLQCPACGATRATHLMFHGHFLEALHYNALWVVLFPFCLYGLFSWAVHATFRRKVIPRIHVFNWIPNAVLIAMGVFFVVRNLPVDFLSVLNPPR